MNDLRVTAGISDSRPFGSAQGRLSKKTRRTRHAVGNVGEIKRLGHAAFLGRGSEVERYSALASRFFPLAVHPILVGKPGTLAHHHLDSLADICGYTVARDGRWRATPP